MKFYIQKHDTNDAKLKIIDNLNKIIAEAQGESDIEITINTNRTLRQNSALHKYFTMLSDAFTEQGLDFQTVFKKPHNLFITPTIIKEFMWKPVQKAMFKSESTKDLKKQKEIDMVYDVLNKKMAEFGIYVPFPSRINNNEPKLSNEGDY